MVRNKIKIYQLMEIIGKITKTTVDHEVMDFYWDALSDYSDQELIESLTDIATKAQRFPTVWEIEKNIKPITQAKKSK